MRLTLDANILVRAAIRPNGPAWAVFEFAIRTENRLVLSRAILDEVRRVLGYERIRKHAGITPEQIDRFLNLLEKVSEMTAPIQIVAVCRDPDDDAVIATAIEGRSEVLCTLDRHFYDPTVIAYCTTHAIRIVSDVEILREFRDPTED